MSNIETHKPEPAPSNPATSTERQPVLIIGSGRQRVGKTTLLSVLTETYRSLGADIEIWNADLLNRTNTLSLFHPDALQPPAEATIEEQRAWLESRVREQVQHRRDVILDVGGGLTALSALIEELRLVEMLERRGIRVVLLYVMGNERADLDYLERFAENKTFMPEATLIVFNAGLLTNGRSVNTAFDALMHHRVVVQAAIAGARIARMPALGCMAAVTDRGLSFADFAAGKQVEGHDETSFFDQERVWLWLNRDMPTFFLNTPQEWLPATTLPLMLKA